MRRDWVFVMGIVAFLSCLSITPVYAGVQTVSTKVDYSVSSNHIRYIDATHSFDANFTVVGSANYSCSVAGVIPPSAVCRWNASSVSGWLWYSFALSNNSTNPTLNMKGNGLKSFPRILLNNSAVNLELSRSPNPIVTMTITIHGRMLGDLSTDYGSADPSQLMWSAWGANATTVSASVGSVILNMSTTYRAYITVAFSMPGWNSPSGDSDSFECIGVPSVGYVIPEFTSFFIVPLFMSTTLIAAIFHKKNRVD